MRTVVGLATVSDLDAFVARLDDVADAHGVTVQAFDARYVAGERHLERAIELADRAFERGENVARDRGVEVLLYAAGRRQIDRALEMGVSEGETLAVVLIDGDDETGAAAAVADLLEVADAAVGDAFDPDLARPFFGVSAVELTATAGDLRDVVLERVALLDVEK